MLRAHDLAIYGPDHNAESTAYRSTWNYYLADIVKSLEAYCTREQLDPKTTYVWICFACINRNTEL